MDEISQHASLCIPYPISHITFHLFHLPCRTESTILFSISQKLKNQKRIGFIAIDRIIAVTTTVTILSTSHALISKRQLIIRRKIAYHKNSNTYTKHHVINSSQSFIHLKFTYPLERILSFPFYPPFLSLSIPSTYINRLSFLHSIKKSQPC